MTPADGMLSIPTNINKEEVLCTKELIAAICEKNEIDFDWMSENILRAYHGKKVDVIEMSDSDTESIIKAAIQKIR